MAGPGAGAEDYSFVKRKVVTEGRKVVAIVSVYRLNAHPRDVMGVDWFAIDPGHWRKGLGTRLVGWAIAQARSHRKDTIFVWSIKKAVPFYKKLGFRQSKRRILRESKRTVLLAKKIY